jgi:phosphopantetheinyl transferase (holo-ACP synthase)
MQSRLHGEGRRLLSLFECDRPASPVITEPDGRPYFEDNHANFSISHSGRAVAVAYTTLRSPAAGAPLRIGCDIQRIDRKKNRTGIAREFFSPREQEYVLGGDSEDGPSRFYQIWVLKEAFLKAFGLPLGALRTTPSFAVTRNRDAGTKHVIIPHDLGSGAVPLVYFLYESRDELHGHYCLALAVEDPGGISLNPRIDIIEE